MFLPRPRGANSPADLPLPGLMGQWRTHPKDPCFVGFVRFVHTCRDLSEFLQIIQDFPGFQSRDQYRVWFPGNFKARKALLTTIWLHKGMFMAPN